MVKHLKFMQMKKMKKKLMHQKSKEKEVKLLLLFLLMEILLNKWHLEKILRLLSLEIITLDKFKTKENWN